MSFQRIFLAIFGLMAVIAVVVFSKGPSKSDVEVPGVRGSVVIWGTFPLDDNGLGAVMRRFNSQYEKMFSTTYVFHDPNNFDRDIVEALASGKGPDILLLPDNLILRHTDKIELIPYTTISQLTYKSLFIQASEIYMSDKGVLALPFAIDPMVMYWNRDLFNNASITQPPQYWDDLLLLTPKLTNHDPKTNDITQSAVAFGEYVNITNAKDIIAMLFLQIGNTIVRLSDGKPVTELTLNSSNRVVPNEDVVSAFRFYMDFSNPRKSIYTWSRAHPSSRDEFINGNLAMYFGFASEYKMIQDKNPHLNFAVAPIPQPRGTKVEITLGHMHGLAVTKTSQNKQTAFYVIQHLLESKTSGDFAAVFNLPPVRRDLLGVRPTDAVLAVFYDSAIRARAWLDPIPEETDQAFRQTVESVSSGKNNPSDAITYLDAQLKSALKVYQ